jgi:hypothetical protein
MAARRILAFAVTWLVALAVIRVAVAPSEHCAPVSRADAHIAATEAVGWFFRNHRPDGRFMYQYDAEAGSVDPGYQVTRHAGVAMSLYEAHAAGIARALPTADRATTWSLERLERRRGWAALTDQGAGELRTGSTALTVAGLAVRRLATGDGRHDDVMAELGRFLVAMTEPSGAVLEAYDLRADRPVPGRYSYFFTGEAFWALALLDRINPGGEWAEPTRRVAHYLTMRDRVEDLFPPVSDHWAARGLAELDRPLTVEHQRYVRRLAGIFGLEVRVESQRQGRGVNRLLRPAHASGSGLGTLGEGLGSLGLITQGGPGFDPDVGGRIDERLRCTASLLVHRQVGAEEAARSAQPDRVRGAWLDDGVTRMDDQQHALSALLLAEPVLQASSGQGGPSGDDDLGRMLWLAVIGIAALNPVRTRGGARRLSTSGAAIAGGVLLATAVLASPVLRAIDVSPPTALVAAGAVVIVSAVVDLARRSPPDPALLDALRPAVVLLVVAAAADAGRLVGVIVALAVTAAAATGSGTGRLFSTTPGPTRNGGWRVAVAAVAVLGGLDLIADGVFGI